MLQGDECDEYENQQCGEINNVNVGYAIRNDLIKKLEADYDILSEDPNNGANESANWSQERMRCKNSSTFVKADNRSKQWIAYNPDSIGRQIKFITETEEKDNATRENADMHFSSSKKVAKSTSRAWFTLEITEVSIKLEIIGAAGTIAEAVTYGVI